jgi:hypothetical protein
VRYRRRSNVYGTVGVVLGARLDEPAFGSVFSFGVGRTLSPRFAAGLRLELGLAPTADDPVSGGLLLDVSQSPIRALELQLGAGLAWTGDLGLAYRLGIGTARGALSLGLRLSGAITPETRPATLGVGAELSF